MMTILHFEEAIDEIEGTDIEDFEHLWNLAMETCATIAHDCGENQIAWEIRDLKQE